jgi:hypothetical protein
MQIPLYESATAVADVNGNAIVRLSPQVAGSSWTIQRMVTAIPAMSPQNFVLHKVYKNSVTEANRLDATSSGAQDTSETNIPVATTDVIIGTWAGVTIGASCTLTVTGTKETGRA